MDHSIKSWKALTRDMAVIALPMLGQYLSEYILVTTDTAFVSQYNLQALSGVNNVIQPHMLVMSFFYALSQGLAILVAQNMGAGRPGKARRIAESAFFFNTLFAVVAFAFWLLLGRKVLVMLGATGPVLEAGADYIRVLSFIYLFSGVGLTIGAFFQGIGITVPVMIASVIRSGLNIFLDWVMVFGNLGFPEMGVTGAALATVLSELTATVYLLFAVMRNRTLPLRWVEWLKPRVREYWRIIRIGIPAGLEAMLWSVGPVVLVKMLNQLDQLSAGYYGIVDRIIGLSVYIYLGISSASLTLVGRATGEKNWKEAQRAGHLCLFYSLVICAVIGMVIMSFPAGIYGIFTRDGHTISMLKPMTLWIVGITFPKAVNIVVGNSIRGTGDTRWMLYTQIFGTAWTIGLAYYLIFILKLGFYGLLIAFLSDEAIRAAVNYLKFRWHRPREKHLKTELP